MANQTGGTQMPIANQEAADRASTTSRARMQANASAPSAGAAMMAGPAAAQKAAGVQAQEQGQIVAQAQDAVVQKSVGQAQQELHDTELRQKEQQTIHAEAMGKRHASAKNRMNSFGRDIKQKLFEDQLTFDKTEREAKFANQRQMSDFMSIKAADEQSMKNYEQAVQAAIQKDIIMLESAFNALSHAEVEAAGDENKRLDKEANARVAAAKKAIAARLKRSRGRAAYTKQGIGVLKVAAGAYIATLPGGQAAGGSLAMQGGSEIVAAEGEK